MRSEDSDVNVPSLRRFVAADMQLQLSKQIVSEDIRLFCVHQFEDAVIMTCASLAERFSLDSIYKPQNGASSLRFVHPKIKEMLVESADIPLITEETPKTIQKLIPARTAANLDLARCCLRQMAYHTPTQPLSGKFNEYISATHLHTNFPFIDYAAFYWIMHINSGMVDASSTFALDGSALTTYGKAFSGFSTSLSTFLSEPRIVTTWLESFYTTNHPIPQTNARPN